MAAAGRHARLSGSGGRAPGRNPGGRRFEPGGSHNVRRVPVATGCSAAVARPTGGREAAGSSPATRTTTTTPRPRPGRGPGPRRLRARSGVRSPTRSRPASRAPRTVGSEIVVHPLQISALHHVLPPGGMTSEPPLPDCRTSLVTRRSVTIRGVQGGTSAAWSMLVEERSRPVARGEVVALSGVLEQRHLRDVRVRPGGGSEAGQGEEDGTSAARTRANEALEIRAADGLAVVLHLGHSAVRVDVDPAVGSSSRRPGVRKPEVLAHELCGRGFGFPPCPDHRLRLLVGPCGTLAGCAWARHERVPGRPRAARRRPRIGGDRPPSTSGTSISQDQVSPIPRAR